MTTSVYVASPYSIGDQALNVRHSLAKCDELRSYGFLPFCPLLSHFWHLIFPHDYKYWLQMDLEWLAKCDAVLRMPGESIGADIEKDFALSLGIPVFFSVDDLLEYFK